MNSRRLGSALAVLAVGVLVMFLATSQTWFHLYVDTAHAQAQVSVFKGSDQRGFTALALGALAAGAALLATRGRGRIAVAVLAALLGAGIVGLAVHSVTDRTTLLFQQRGSVPIRLVGPQVATTNAWPYVAVISGVLVALGGVMAALAGRGAGLSARYEAPSAAPSRPTAPARDFADVATWQALDRDEDPT